MSPPETIFAAASGAGRAAVAVIRISGPAAGAVLRALAGRVPEPRVATLAVLRDAPDESALDRALVLWFPGPRSFTGEDAAELHLHGGRAVVAAVLRALGAIAGCRPAEPGEFTRRAFRNGKMDVAAVEGLADLIDAQTDAQRRQAQRQLEGALGRWVASVRERLLAASAVAEGLIDFAEEEDLRAPFEAEVVGHARDILSAIDAELGACGRAEKLRDGLVVTIAGAPNVGKSSLLNAIAGREAAIVSVHAGTTRDPIEVDLDLGGYPVTLVDTAGLRPTEDPVEREGIARALARARGADLVLWLRDGPATEGAESRPVTDGEVWTLRTKADLTPLAGPTRGRAVSARTGAGLADLTAALTRFAAARLVGGETAVVTRLRHRLALEGARRSLAPVADGSVRDGEIVAEHLRSATRALEALVGRVDAEDVLGAIFARFCIGK